MDEKPISIHDIKELTTTFQKFNVKTTGYLLIRNIGLMDLLFSLDNGLSYITIKSGRTFEANKHLIGSLFYLASSPTGGSAQILIGEKPWGTSDAINEIWGPVTGNLLTTSQDTAQTASGTVTHNFQTSLGRWGKGFSFVADQTVQVLIRLRGYSSSPVFRVSANLPFSFPPGPSPVDIVSVAITDVSGVTWHMDFVGY